MVNVLELEGWITCNCPFHIKLIVKLNFSALLKSEGCALFHYAPVMPSVIAQQLSGSDSDKCKLSLRDQFIGDK